MRPTATPAVALTIAGSDSGGGAGVQADLLAFAAHGVHGTTALTAVTVQDTRHVHALHAVPHETVTAQAVVVLDDFAVAAVKTGMLATAQTARAVGGLAAAGRLPNLVVDPVMVSSTGAPLVDAEGLAAYLEHLLPYATVVTPNLAEAEALLDRPVRTPAQMRAAAADLAALGPAALVTGGHLDGCSTTLDVLHVAGETYELTGARVVTSNTHGTGCTFSAALTARLALGDEIPAAARAAKAYVTSALAAAAHWRLGHGPGPLAHIHARPSDEENR
jgi:hydroxymethylpyrimidine/phosphomethylpyrimidine kinase